MLRQTAAALQRALPKYFVRTVTIADAEAKTQIERLRPDFLFAPASFSGMTGVEAARIATRRTNLAQSAERSVGALKSSKAPTNYFTPNILRKSWSRLVVSVVHLDALAFPVAAT